VKFKEIGSDVVDWIQVVQDDAHCRVLVNKKMNFHIERIVLLDFIHRLVSQKIESKSTISSILTHNRQNPREITNFRIP
jgi:hypothetical protein